MNELILVRTVDVLGQGIVIRATDGVVSASVVYL